MNICEPFIRRPVATTLLLAAIALAGGVAFRLLPVSPLPQVDFPTVSVSANLPGASPETMATSVATPLERQFGRIASVTEMTSSSGLGSSSVTLQFDLNRNIDAAARDVQAAIAAARGYLPTNLPSNPNYRKVNPADAPILLLALTSKILDKGAMYDAASSIMAQKLSQVQGVGQVFVGGSALPGVRVELNPDALSNYGIGLEQVRTILNGANTNSPKGHFSDGQRMWEVGASDQIFKAADYRPMVIAYHNGTAVRISDVGEAVDSVEDIRNAGYMNGLPSVLLVIFRQPGANIIDTVDRIRATLPQLKAAIPQSIDVRVVMDQTITIRGSVHDVERTLIISVLLVILVVFLFLRSPRTTFIPSVAVPVSLLGTFGVMYLLGYSVDNLSLMALCISTGFVVDDAIVVIENITRYLEMGMKPFAAALKGAQEIGFTVMTISISLIAVFLPLLMMGGVVGRLFREFSVTLSVAIVVSMVVSLTATPMMCAHMLKEHTEHGWLYNTTDRGFKRVIGAYGSSLHVVLRHRFITLLVLLATIALNVRLFIKVPKGFFPQQDNGRLSGQILADQDTSFQAMNRILLQQVNIVAADPAVDAVNGFTGGGRGGSTNTGSMFISLKPLAERKISADLVIARLRPKLMRDSGRQPLPAGQSGYPRGRPQQRRAVSVHHARRQPGRSDRVRAAHVPAAIDNPHHRRRQQRSAEPRPADPGDLRPRHRGALRHLAAADRQYALRRLRPAPGLDHVQAAEPVPRGDGGGARATGRTRQILRNIYVRAPSGSQVPLSAFAQFAPTTAPLSVNHQGLFPGGHHLVQPAAGRGARATRWTPSSRCRARSACRPPFRPCSPARRRPTSESLGNQPILIAAALPPSTWCWASSTKATSIPSRFFPPCLRPAWARCWR